MTSERCGSPPPWPPPEHPQVTAAKLIAKQLGRLVTALDRLAYCTNHDEYRQWERR